MSDDISLSLISCLHGNAIALNRSAGQNQRALKNAFSVHAKPHQMDTNHPIDGPNPGGERP